MNWNPSYSYAKIPLGLKDVPPYYAILATPVPPDRGLAHFHDVHIWNIHALNARRAFDVSATTQAPLVRFTLEGIKISSRTAGSIRDVRDWSLTGVDVQTQDGSKVKFADAQDVKLKTDQGIEQP